MTVSMVGLVDVNDQFIPLKAMANAAMASGAKVHLSVARKQSIRYHHSTIYGNKSNTAKRWKKGVH